MNSRYSLILLVLLASVLSSRVDALPIYSSTQTAIRDYDNDNIPDEIANYAKDYVINAVDFDSKVFVEFNIQYFTGTFDQAYLGFRVDNYQNLGSAPYFNNHFQLYSYFGADGQITLDDWSVTKAKLGDVIRIEPYVASTWSFESQEFEVNISDLLRAAIGRGDSYFGIMIENPIEIPFLGSSGLTTVNNFDVFERVSVPAPSSISLMFFAVLGFVKTRKMCRYERLTQGKLNN